MRRRFLAVAAGIAASALLSSVALGHECFNPNKQPAAGAQVMVNLVTGEVIPLTQGIERRLEQGLIDPDTGEGFQGLVAFDFDGDGTAELTTWIVGPDDEIPQVAQDSGPACQGITNIGVFFTQCLGS